MFRPRPVSAENRLLIILMLGALITINPFAIDMYLAAFPQIASDYNTTTAVVAYSLSSYFLGLALGQLFYGPLLDKYGRKPPIYAGLALFILGSIGCMFSDNITMLVAFRLLQGIGGCVAQIGAMSMVRDYFPQKESAKIFSLMMLVLSVSPLFAPSIGSVLSVAFGWQSVFLALPIVASLIVFVLYKYLPKGYEPDSTLSLKPKALVKGYLETARNTQFITYVVASGCAFSCLFIYLSASPAIFMEHFGVSAHTYGIIFATLSTGIIGANQVNIFLMKWFSSEQLVKWALMGQLAVLLVFLGGTLAGGLNLWGTIAVFYLFLACLGIVSPNTSALALAPFTTNLGRASALMAFIGTIMNCLAMALTGMVGSGSNIMGLAILMAASPTLALIVLYTGRRRIKRKNLRTIENLPPEIKVQQHEPGL